MDTPIPICRGEDRRKHLFRNPNWNGIDFLEVIEGENSHRVHLCVHFFGGIPANITVDNVRIEGGARVRDVRATGVGIDSSNDPDVDDCLRIALDKAGDFSTYRLCLVETVKGKDGCSIERPLPGLDPRYACLEFSFKIDCPGDLDCKATKACESSAPPAPEINYLAKDYASFRSLILDRLALTMPDWKERHVPDIGIVLVELLAYVGDRLSYYQDAVATEAYLETARRRISVRRHARLVDYTMHEGCNARTFVSVETDADLPPIKAGEFFFITGFAAIKARNGRVVAASDLEQVPVGTYESYEPLASIGTSFTFRAAHTRIPFHTWGDSECCLAKGTKRAILVDGVPDKGSVRASRALHLAPGDFLIFEEVRGPRTGTEGDADPAHRHAVRLTKVTPGRDELLGQNTIEIEWSAADALPFSLCLSARLSSPDCGRVDNISVARGNIVLVDHGTCAAETLGPVESEAEYAECACEGSVIERTVTPAKFEPPLRTRGLAFAEPVHPGMSASAVLLQDPRKAAPAIVLREHQMDGVGAVWSSRADLLGSGPDDRHFVAEIDENGRANLRFGNGELGRMPDTGTCFDASYRVGGGPAGNSGRDTITFLVLRNPMSSSGNVSPRNPLPAIGGALPETSASVKLLAPTAFRARRERAITADDYAEIAGRHDGLQRAAAELCWTGSWYAADVYADPAGTESAGAELLADIDRYLWRYRRIGHDLEVDQARYVPLDVAIHVCVKPHYARGAVKAELIKRFGTGTFAGGALGFFHPDSLSFGGGIYISRMIALARAIEGIQDATVTRLSRLGEPSSEPPEGGVLEMGAFEVARCDSDPNSPENGRIEFIVEGGR